MFSQSLVCHSLTDGATTRLRKVPSRSIVSSTRSPGLSQPPAASGVSSRMHPEPTVPDPSTSPGRKVASRLAWASNRGQVQYIEPEFPRDNKRPLTAAVISRFNRPSLIAVR